MKFMAHFKTTNNMFIVAERGTDLLNVNLDTRVLYPHP